MTDHERLVRLLAARSAKRGKFTLASGRESDLYIDARQTTMTADGQVLVGQQGLAAIAAEGWSPKAVGGLTMGADPIAYAICHASASSRRPLSAFSVRKEAKTHGTGKLVEGPVAAGDEVVIIEDTMTTGQSAAKAIEAVRAMGAVPLGVLVLVDREEGGREHIQSLGLGVCALARASEIIPHVS